MRMRMTLLYIHAGRLIEAVCARASANSNATLQLQQSYLGSVCDFIYNRAVESVLRDGVRLTKVMEIILLRDDLTCQLRVPAISRTQRVHNVGLALKALEQANFDLTVNIILLL